MRKLVVTVVAMAFMLASCTDSANKTQNFSSQAEAEAAILDNAEGIYLAVELALVAVAQTNFDGSFTGGLPLFKSTANKKVRLNRPLDDTATYDGSTGWWTYTEQETEIEDDATYTLDLLAQLRFTPRGLNGLATEATNKMEYKADVNWEIASSDATFVLSYDTDLTFTGLDVFNASTGNAVLNGTTDFGFEISSSSPQGSLSLEYSYDIDYDNVAFANGGEYPESGRVDFIVRLNVTPNIEGFDEYNVEGSITFDGDNTAQLVFGGWNFVINLDTGEIIPA